MQVTLMKKMYIPIGMLFMLASFLSAGCVAEQNQQVPPAGDFGNGPQDCTDYVAAAAALGITEEELRTAIHPGPDFTAAAAMLGVTEESLQDALGSFGGFGKPRQQGEPGQAGPDFSAAAATLGVTEEALISALGMDRQETRMDLASMAAELGVTEDALKAVMGTPGEEGPGDFAAMAAELGVSEDELRSVMGPGERDGAYLTRAAGALGITQEELQAALDAAKIC